MPLISTCCTFTLSITVKRITINIFHTIPFYGESSLFSACGFVVFVHQFVKKIGSYWLIFSVSGFIHMILDSIVGDIWWLAPFYNRPFSLVTVPSIYDPWWLNFIFHWSFFLEICLVVYALWILRRPSPHNSVQRLNRRSRCLND